MKAPSDADAFTIFETLNDRGADLTISDLLKNLLFSRATKTEIEVVKQRWIEARAIIDELKPRTDMMTFLRHFWSSRHGATRERDLYKKIKANVTNKEQALQFSKELREDASWYSALLNPADESWKEFSPTAKVALSAFDRFNLEQIRPMLLAVYRHFSKKESERAAKSILNWSVRGLVGGVIGAGKAESYFCNAAVAIRSGSVKTVAQLLVELKELIPSDAEFENVFERYRTTNNSFARYILYGLERSFAGESEPELVPNQNVDEVNLEHILPQKAKVSDWPDFSNELIPIFSYRIGNMTLLPKGKNGKLGNKSFAEKKPVLAASNYNLNQVFQATMKWTSAEIEARQLTFSKRAASVWPL